MWKKFSPSVSIGFRRKFQLYESKIISCSLFTHFHVSRRFKAPYLRLIASLHVRYSVSSLKDWGMAVLLRVFPNASMGTAIILDRSAWLNSSAAWPSRCCRRSVSDWLESPSMRVKIDGSTSSLHGRKSFLCTIWLHLFQRCKYCTDARHFPCLWNDYE